MSLLPRSRRGTWLLAVTVWLAACAELWWMLPVVPRAKMQLDHHEQLQGFGPDGQTAVVLRVVRNQHIPSGAASQFQLIEVPSARLVQIIAEVSEYGLLGHTRDGRIWLFHRRTGGEPRFLMADLTTKTIEPLAISPPLVNENGRNRLSPNGRYCVLHRTESLESVLLWDIQTNREVQFPVAIRSPIVFALDESFAAAPMVDEPNTICLVDLRSLAVRAKLAGPANTRPTHLRITLDDKTIAAVFRTSANDPQTTSREWWAWDIASGRAVLAQQIPFSYVTPQTALPISSRFASVQPDFSEQTVFPCPYPIIQWPIPESLPMHALPEFATSSDGRFCLLPVEELTTSWLANGFQRIGIFWFSNVPDQRVVAALYDAPTGKRIAEIPVELSRPQPGSAPFLRFVWMPNGRGFAVNNIQDPTRTWYIWDMQPGKSLTWLLLSASLLAVIVTFLARRRVRRISRAEA